MNTHTYQSNNEEINGREANLQSHIRSAFKRVIPAIQEGSVEVVKVSTLDTRCKVGVRAIQPSIDPVWACVGVGGSYVKYIKDLLEHKRSKDEILEWINKIDVYEWDDHSDQLIENALLGQRANLVDIEIFQDQKQAKIVVPEDQIGYALGPGRVNIELAMLATGYHIEIMNAENGSYIPSKSSTRQKRGKAGASISGGLPSLSKRR